MKKNQRTAGYLLAAAYLASILVAAWLVAFVGIVPVGLGLMAPAGAYVIGLTLVLRDMTQDQLGPWATYIVVIIGTILSWFLSPTVAVASAVAFLASETVDMIVYTPIRARGKIVAAVVTSNVISIVLDSFLFVTIAFGYEPGFIVGQIWAKAVATALSAVFLVWLYRNRTDRRPMYIVRREAASV